MTFDDTERVREIAQEEYEKLLKGGSGGYVQRINDLHKALTEERADKKDLLEKSLQVCNERDALEAKVTELSDELVKTKAERHRLFAEIGNKDTDINNAQHCLRVQITANNEMKEKIKTLEAEVTGTDQDTQRQIEALQRTNREVSRASMDRFDLLNKLKDGMESPTWQVAVDKAIDLKKKQDEIFRLANKVCVITENNDALEAKIVEIDNENGDLKEKLTACRQANESLAKRCDELEKSRNMIKSDRDYLSVISNDRFISIKELTEELRVLTRQHKDLDHFYDLNRKELEHLKKLRDALCTIGVTATNALENK